MMGGYMCAICGKSFCSHNVVCFCDKGGLICQPCKEEMESKLIPCPFCGEVDELTINEVQGECSGKYNCGIWYDDYAVRCGSCGATGAQCSSRTEAAKSWSCRKENHQ